MKSTAPDVEQPSPKDSQKLSRFHPRTRSKDGADEEPLPSGEKNGKSNEGWIHTPSGPRRARSSSPVAKAPVAAIPKVDLPDPLSAASKSPPPAVEELPANPEVPAQAVNGYKQILSRLRKEVALLLAVVLAVAFVAGLLLSFKFGKSAGRDAALRSLKQAAAPTVLPTQEFPESALPDLTASLELLRKGENLEALAALKTLLESHPDAPSIHYATAIANLQAGYPREADRMADASIKRGFRVSDSWALKAAILAMQSKGPSAEQEALLKRAIAADPMNPNPLLELATLYRYRKQPEQAHALLNAASLRLNPADARMVIDTTLAILNVDQAAELPEALPPSGIPARDFPNAYAEMKRGNFENAAAILKSCNESLDPDLFSYLVNDPAIRKFASKPELSGLY